MPENNLDELIEKQEVNEMIANVPKEFKVKDKTLTIKSKTISEMVKIDGKIVEIETLTNQDIEVGDDTSYEEYANLIHEKNSQLVELILDVLFYIVNEDIENPSVEKDWIKNNIDVGEGGVAEQIIDAYNEKCTPRSVVKKILLSRKFA